jgi:hypothetical protein
MRTNKEIVQIADGIYAEATASLSKLSEVKKAQVEAIKGMSVEDGFAAVQSIIADIESVIKAPRVNGVALPAYLSKISCDENSIAEVTISVRTKLKSDYKYRKDTVVAVDEKFVLNAGSAYLDALYDMFYIEEAISNVNALNEKIAEIIAENEIGYSFKFAVDENTNSTIISINNDEVVFKADITKALDIAGLTIFKEGDEYNDLIRKEATDSLIDSLKTVQTPVQLIKGGVALIKEITGVSTKKRASKLIRGAYHRQAKFLNGVKAGVGYYNETVSINGEDVDVFALVAKAEDGTLSVVLNPFNVKDLFNVDFDVLAAVKEQLA